MPEKKFMARDCELSTTGIDRDGNSIDSWAVTRAVLPQVDAACRNREALTWSRNSWGGSAYSMDCLRHWSSAGQCYYSDMAHFEACSAESLDPKMFAAQCVSLLLVAEEARQLAELDSDTPVNYQLSASNADVRDPGISWGSHLNVSVSTDLWEDLFEYHTHPARLASVASFLAAGLVFFGAGYLLPLKHGKVIYSLSARAHHLTRVHTLSTTERYARGILNRRKEPLARDQQRLHLIGFDFSLISAALMCSFVQCALAAAEEGYCDLSLYSPVRAVQAWSWNLDMNTGRLPATATLVDGRSVTLPQYIRELVTRLLEMCEAGLITDQVAPKAKELLPQIISLSHYAEEGSINRCAHQLDWAAKLMCLLADGKDFRDPRSRLADHDFANTNPHRGRLWRMWQEGLVDPLIEPADAEACVTEPPAESRAWARGKLIQRFSEQIRDVDWDCVELRHQQYRWSRLDVNLPQLDSLSRSTFEPILQKAETSDELEELLEQLDEDQETAERDQPDVGLAVQSDD